jgi:hypothetical protein
MTSSESLRQMLARFEISLPQGASALPLREAPPACVNGIDLLRRLLRESGDAAAR